jgi:plasmid replication initiation protein
MNDLIVKDNSLIQASYSLSTVEQRLILLAIAEARESGNGLNPSSLLEIRASTYIHYFEVDKTTAYQVLKEASKSLFNRYVTYHDKNPKNGRNRSFHCRWVDKIGYEDQSGLVYLRFTQEVVPLITRLEENFTKYEIKQISKLTSSYAIRLYELIIQWRTTQQTPIFELNTFRNQLGLEPNSYTRMSDFKRNILDFSVAQINEHTDITVKYDQHKAGRVITGFSFTFGFKKSAKPKSTRAQAVEPPPTSDPAAEKREAYGLFLSYQRQSKALNQALETLATNSEMKLFKKLGFMK